MSALPVIDSNLDESENDLLVQLSKPNKYIVK